MSEPITCRFCGGTPPDGHDAGCPRRPFNPGPCAVPGCENPSVLRKAAAGIGEIQVCDDHAETEIEDVESEGG